MGKYRHRVCDEMIQAKFLDCACIGCGGNMVFFDMDVPDKRRDIYDPLNRAWLIRNLGIRNGKHELFDFTMNKLRESTKETSNE